MLVIKQLLCLVHEDMLWVGKPVCITTELVHQVSHLPWNGRDPREITDKGNDVMMIERLRKKYQIAKGQWGYIIDSILDNAICVATHLLAWKVMRKCDGTKVPAIVITLAEEFQFAYGSIGHGSFVKNFRTIAMMCRRKARHSIMHGCSCLSYWSPLSYLRKASFQSWI